MDARTQRTVLRVGSLLAALIVATAIIVLFPSLDARLSGPILGLAITAALGLDQFLKNTGGNAPPSLAAVNTTLQTALNSPHVSVPPPKMAIELNPPTIITTEPQKPFDTIGT